MRRKLIAVAALGVALNAHGTAAIAAPVSADCRLLNVADQNVTGNTDTFVGASAGYVIGANAGETASVRCFVKINGAEVASTPWASGTQAAMTAGQITYTSTDTDQVDLCAEYTVGSEGDTICWDTILVQVPPQEVRDLVVTMLDTIAPFVGQAVVTANGVMSCITVVNLGTCASGICLVNTGYCGGGFCVVNTGNCWRDCIAVVNTGDCGTPPPPPPPTRVDPR